MNPDLVQLTELRQVGCTVILGEAGLGKSTAVAAEVEAIRATGGALAISNSVLAVWTASSRKSSDDYVNREGQQT
jgi:hypothetical protein